MVESIERPRRILIAIIGAQFAGTSLWFAGNAILGDLQRSLNLPSTALGPMISSVQLGFIVGTLVFALFGVADRFSPRLVFLVSAIAGAGFNLGIAFAPGDLMPILCLRFMTGFALAGIYPVGMKIAAGWYKSGLGAALGWLVGALVLGTALPHGVRAIGADLAWQTVLATVSAVAAGGGIALFLLVPDGPFLTKGGEFNPKALVTLFRDQKLRAAAFGYFGHMWELYAFWAVVPLLIAASGVSERATSAWSFAVIAVGFFGCGLGGLVSLQHGSAFVSRAMLLVSGGMCLASPFVIGRWEGMSLAALLLWGFTVVGDSPQFSTHVAKSAPRTQVGTALTIVNSIGFAITIPAIELLTRLSNQWAPETAMLILVPGPVFGLWASRKMTS